MSQVKGLKLVTGCGDSNRAIYIIDGNDKIQIGCTLYTKQDAINAIEEKYTDQDQLDYISKVNECYDSDVTPWSILKDDFRGIVRLEVAKHGQYLDQLKDDGHWRIRWEIAKQGKYLEQFKDDVECEVRCAVASQGQYLEQLKDDSMWVVRMEIAKQGKYLEQFKEDEDCDVRIEVAKQGKYLEKFKDDKHWRVRETALEMLKTS